MPRPNWSNLTKDERREYMNFQMAKKYPLGDGGYLPDDCSECGVCGQPTLGFGLCPYCREAFKVLKNKLQGGTNPSPTR
jgi:hypothetical protein